MGSMQRCAECGAMLPSVNTCQDYFHQLLAWEFAYPALTAGVHHLLVLCYHLQHPSLYSPAGLDWAKHLLVAFWERGLSPAEVRRQSRAALDSGRRSCKIKGTATFCGSYDVPIPWTLTVADVAAGGVGSYCDNVRAWARSVHAALTAAGSLP